MPRAQQQYRKREVIAWTAPPAAIQLKPFPRTRGPHPTYSTAECRQLISFQPTLSEMGRHAGVACTPRPCRSSTMSPSNIVSNSDITCSSLSSRAFAMKGLPISSVRNCSHRLMFVPAGRMFFGAQRPRLLTRAICLYIDPHTVPVDPDFRFAEVELRPRLLLEDAGLWETVRKLKAQIGSADPAARLHAEALGGLLSIELLRLLRDGAPASRPLPRGGLAAWQQKRVMDFIEEHLSEDVSLDVLSDLA